MSSFSPQKLNELESFISLIDSQPALLHLPQLQFFRDYLTKMGGTVPAAPKKEEVPQETPKKEEEAKEAKEEPKTAKTVEPESESEESVEEEIEDVFFKGF